MTEEFRPDEESGQTPKQLNTQFREYYGLRPPLPKYDIDELETSDQWKEKIEQQFQVEPVKEWQEKLRALLSRAQITEYFQELIVADSYGGVADSYGKEEDGSMKDHKIEGIGFNPENFDLLLKEMGLEDAGGIFDSEQAKIIERRAFRTQLETVQFQPGGEFESVYKSMELEHCDSPDKPHEIAEGVLRGLLAMGALKMQKWGKEFIEKHGENPQL